ncbi:hypothetical protein LXL04_017985 [Taraxacum kok-saghyz]
MLNQFKTRIHIVQNTNPYAKSTNLCSPEEWQIGGRRDVESEEEGSSPQEDVVHRKNTSEQEEECRSRSCPASEEEGRRKYSEREKKNSSPEVLDRVAGNRRSNTTIIKILIQVPLTIKPPDPDPGSTLFMKMNVESGRDSYLKNTVFRQI